AEIVIGKPHTYDIPDEAYPSRSEVSAKKGILAMAQDACCEGERCLQCGVICENCVDSCPNRANVAIRLANGSHQILHVDKMCNECGNCTQFCPYASEPCHDKFTLFQTAEDMDESSNSGVLFTGANSIRVRLGTFVRDVDLTGETDLPVELEEMIFAIRDKYGYLYQ
ncbi:MAG: putative selenate reductase subunit YgfK, partial [Oscillospiraceae bacterium]|nr:putative selenate reductase subunit YgfK [Oscillospiraceae bacterium]